MRIILLCSLAALLTACQSTDYAHERIALSSQVKEQFKNWQRLATPQMFVVSTDGRSAAWNYCPEFGGCSTSNQLGELLSRCAPRSTSGKCVVYGQYGKTVVEDPDLAAPTVQAGTDKAFNLDARRPVEAASPRPATTTQVLPPTDQKAPTPPPASAYDRLATLKDLADRKLITPAEHEAKRKEVLGGL
jgi:hypothetical protein